MLFSCPECSDPTSIQNDGQRRSGIYADQPFAVTSKMRAALKSTTSTLARTRREPILSGPLTLMLCIASVPLAVQGEDLVLTETEDTIRITLREKPVLEYVKTARPVPSGLDQYYQRSGYIHPVFTPTGEQVTGDYPLDHAHQHALFFAWTKATFDGTNVDFWNQAKQQAGIDFRGLSQIKRSRKRVSFCVSHAFTVGQGNERMDAIHETWTVSVYLTPSDHFLFDVESRQRCASDKPLRIEEYHYGGMAVRGNATWLKVNADRTIQPGDLQFLTSEGKDRWDGNHTRPHWVAMSGQIAGQDVSLTVLCHPDNFRAPQPVRLHPNKPYFCFAPSVVGEFKIKPGEEYVSRYRYLVTSKPVDVDLVEKHWKQYSSSNEDLVPGEESE
ncbi:hypothetical protein Pan14r_14350 [Crateriforma conspicua]|uniref:Methane oxygenase PmoA n=2 Tax=Crateriforma conspicua TaxID=2527996 RepID=A0A5C5Y382_9PLAN|nr:hypothetical protein Pan14r_14350 [Crateriforma conspicua]